MNRMMVVLALALAGCGTVADCERAEKNACEYPSVIEEGFVSLFNGHDLSGWYGATDMYGIEAYTTTFMDGSKKTENVLACFPERHDPKRSGKGRPGNLLTVKEYGNFILRFEFMMPENGNNGLGIRTPSPEVDAAYEGMCELQLLDDGGSNFYDVTNRVDLLGQLHFTGSIYGIYAPRRDNFDKQIWGKEKNFTPGGSYVRKPGMWNFEEVRVIGSEIEVYLNGVLINKGDVSKFKGDGDTPDGLKHPGLHRTRGHIGWLGHGSHVRWKNIRIKELPDDAKMGDVCPRQTMAAPEGFKPCFTGTMADLNAHWKGVTEIDGFDNPIVRRHAPAKKVKEMQAVADVMMREHWSVRNGNLFFDGFKGGYSLATKKDYGDFEMWADWRLMSITGDSGLYLRGLPQVQIWDAHNQWNIGSGGLYNNQKACSKALKIADRPIGDWNRFHIIMRGDKVTVWLNGECVVDNVVLENYWDRKIPAFARGQIELQCHGDPIEWRNIFIREL